MIATVTPHVSTIPPPSSSVPRTVQPPDTRHVAATWIAPCQEGEVCYPGGGGKDGGRGHCPTRFEHVATDFRQVASVHKILDYVRTSAVQNDERSSTVSVTHLYCPTCSRIVRHHATTNLTNPCRRDEMVRMGPPAVCFRATDGGPSVSPSGQCPTTASTATAGPKMRSTQDMFASLASHLSTMLSIV